MCDRVQDGRRVCGLAACLVAALAAVLGGCSNPLAASGLRIESFEQGTVLSPRIASRGYRAINRSTAEVYLSDIPLNTLNNAESFEELDGTIVRVTMFLLPRPGKTPIESTASTATVQAVVLARGEVGVYGGGGFMLPDGTPGDETFGGSIRGGSMRLLAATHGFEDRLGASRFFGGFSAPNDAGAAGLMGHVFEQAAAVAGGE